jgi:hypothetical protein
LLFFRYYHDHLLSVKSLPIHLISAVIGAVLCRSLSTIHMCVYNTSNITFILIFYIGGFNILASIDVDTVQLPLGCHWRSLRYAGFIFLDPLSILFYSVGPILFSRLGQCFHICHVRWLSKLPFHLLLHCKVFVIKMKRVHDRILNVINNWILNVIKMSSRLLRLALCHWIMQNILSLYLSTSNPI